MPDVTQVDPDALAVMLAAIVRGDWTGQLVIQFKDGDIVTLDRRELTAEVFKPSGLELR
jgi:hypothetical protein